MERDKLLNKVRHCTPNLGWEDKYPDLYGKYGMTICGICEYWHWFEEDNITDYAIEHGHLPLTDATDNELLEMWAIADNYWLQKYTEWYKRSTEKSSKLDRFIGECERKYFGYDKDGYTDKTIDRILNSIFKILDSNKQSILSGELKE